MPPFSRIDATERLFVFWQLLTWIPGAMAVNVRRWNRYSSVSSLVNVTVAVVTPSLKARNLSAKSFVASAGTCRGREHHKVEQKRQDHLSGKRKHSSTMIMARFGLVRLHSTNPPPTG